MCKKTLINVLAVSLVLAQGLGCEPELTPGGFEAQDRPDVGDNGDNDTGQSQVDFTDMTGTWALVVDLSICALVFGINTEIRNRSVTRVEVVQEGLKLTEIHDDCESGNTPLAGLAITVPLTTVNSGNPMDVSGTLFGTNVGDTYRNSTKARVWGIDLPDARADDFPTLDDLPDDRIFDADNDGNPGVTLDVNQGSCQIYIIQRALESVSGTLMPDGSIEGTGSLLTVQTILDATNALCETPYDLFPNDGRGENVMRMVRVDEKGLNLDNDGDGEVSCLEILAQREEILTYREPDDARCAAPQDPTEE